MNSDLDREFEIWLEQEYQNQQTAQSFYQDCVEHDLERLQVWD